MDVSGSGKSEWMYCIIGIKIQQTSKIRLLRSIEKIRPGSRILDAGADEQNTKFLNVFLNPSSYL